MPWFDLAYMGRRGLRGRQTRVVELGRRLSSSPTKIRTLEKLGLENFLTILL